MNFCILIQDQDSRRPDLERARSLGDYENYKSEEERPRKHKAHVSRQGSLSSEFEDRERGRAEREEQGECSPTLFRDRDRERERNEEMERDRDRLRDGRDGSPQHPMDRERDHEMADMDPRRSEKIKKLFLILVVKIQYLIFIIFV